MPSKREDQVKVNAVEELQAPPAPAVETTSEVPPPVAGESAVNMAGMVTVQIDPKQVAVPMSAQRGQLQLNDLVAVRTLKTIEPPPVIGKFNFRKEFEFFLEGKIYLVPAGVAAILREKGVAFGGR